MVWNGEYITYAYFVGAICRISSAVRPHRKWPIVAMQSAVSWLEDVWLRSFMYRATNAVNCRTQTRTAQKVSSAGHGS